MLRCKKELDANWKPLVFDLFLAVLAFFAACDWLSEWWHGDISWRQGGFYIFPVLAVFVWAWFRLTVQRISSSINEVKINDDGTVEINSSLQTHKMAGKDIRYIHKVAEYHYVRFKGYIANPTEMGPSGCHYEFATKMGVFQVPDMDGLDVIIDMIRRENPAVVMTGPTASPR